MDDVRDAAPDDGGTGATGDSGATSSPGFASIPKPVVPATVGGQLRAAREAMGLTLTDVAARTRITLRHVQALDRGDLAALPGRPYVLGFVRNFARVVGLDEVALTELARAEMDAGVPRVAPRMVHQFDVDDPAKTPSRLVTWLALALVLAVLAAGGVFWRSYYAPGADLPAVVVPEPVPSSAEPSAELSDTSSAPAAISAQVPPFAPQASVPVGAATVAAPAAPRGPRHRPRRAATDRGGPSPDPVTSASPAAPVPAPATGTPPPPAGQ